MGAASDFKELLERMDELVFWSEDHRFGLRIPVEQWRKLRGYCEAAGTVETGGVLVGFYTPNHDCAIVTDISGAPPDSKQGMTWFHRGIENLQGWLHRLWLRRSRHYLGEWHYHPLGDLSPSTTDKNEMKRIASSVLYRCPEPLLFIVGGNHAIGNSVRAFVFPQTSVHVELFGQEGRER